MADAAARMLEEVKQNVSAREFAALGQSAISGHPNWAKVVLYYPKFSDWLKLRAKSYEGRLGPWRVNVSSYWAQQKIYFDKTRAELGRIIQFGAGRALRTEVDSTAFRIFMQPYAFAPVLDYTFQAYAAAGKRPDGCTTCGLRAGVPVLDDDGDPIKKLGLGRGGGTPVKMGYTPWFHGPNGVGDQYGPASDADEVLFHELVHASRFLRGISHGSSVSGGYGNLEEYLAIVLGNIYLSEKRQTTLRGGHVRGAPPLAATDKYLKNPEGIRPTPRQVMGQFRNEQRVFFDALADLNPKPFFNPAWEYKEELKRKAAQPKAAAQPRGAGAPQGK